MYNAAGAVVGSPPTVTRRRRSRIANPAAGTYTVEVDGYSVPAGSTAYDYQDVFFSAALGTVTVAGGDADARPTARPAPSPAPSPPSRLRQRGRELFGEMKVISSEGATLGTGAVKITKVVTPAG